MHFLTSLFLTIASSLHIPTAWKLATIVPLPKSSMKDPSNPLQYRVMSLLSIPYKLFTKILNNVLCEWLKSNNILVEDAQCGFRAGRSTTEQVKHFAAFIDFQKVYYSIQHNLLYGISWNRIWCPLACYISFSVCMTT